MSDKWSVASKNKRLTVSIEPLVLTLSLVTEFMSTTGGIKVFTGNANRALAEEICHYLSCDPGRALTERFSDGE